MYRTQNSTYATYFWIGVFFDFNGYTKFQMNKKFANSKNLDAYYSTP